MALLILDENVAYGFQSGAGGWNTSKVSGGGGVSYRNVNWALPLRPYQFAFDNKPIADIQAIMELIDDVRGAAYPWLLKDWANYQLTDELILTAAGSETTAQIKQTWGTNNVLSLDRKYIKSGTLSVEKNGEPLTLTADYTVNSTGLITFVDPLDPDDEITVTCEFYMKVRFDEDTYYVGVNGPLGAFADMQSISATEDRS